MLTLVTTINDGSIVTDRKNKQIRTDVAAHRSAWPPLDTSLWLMLPESVHKTNMKGRNCSKGFSHLRHSLVELPYQACIYCMSRLREAAS